MSINGLRLRGRRRWVSPALLGVLLGLALLAPAGAAACELVDPGCYIDAFAHGQIHELSLSVWQINRAGLILARWIEDMRGWLIDSMLVTAFDSLKLPALIFFHLALIAAWMIFVISYMVQSLIDLRWVDIRRAMRPVLLAYLIYQFGGTLLKESEYARQVGSALLQQAGQSAVQAAGAPKVPTATDRVADMPPITGLYRAATCATTARQVDLLALNDYAAHYLQADGEDIHCAGIFALPTSFRTRFFSAGNNVANVNDGTARQLLVSQAAQGTLRQITGLFMTSGAVIEQLIHLLFALALALVWFGLLISLVFAVFLPTEALFAQQIRAMLAVIRASWLASLLLGIGLAALRLVADTGNGLLMLVGGLMLIAMCLWQGRQALAMMQLAGTSAGSALGGAPQAVGGMLRSWGTTGALVAGAVATGGMGSTTAEIGAALARRLGRNAGDNPLARATGRVLSRRIAHKLETMSDDQRIEQEVDLSEAEGAWYERASGMPDAPERAQAARRHARKQRARLLDRHATRARLAGDFVTADRLRRRAEEARGQTRDTRHEIQDTSRRVIAARRQTGDGSRQPTGGRHSLGDERIAGERLVHDEQLGARRRIAYRHASSATPSTALHGDMASPQLMPPAAHLPTLRRAQLAALRRHVGAAYREAIEPARLAQEEGAVRAAHSPAPATDPQQIAATHGAPAPQPDNSNPSGGESQAPRAAQLQRGGDLTNDLGLLAQAPVALERANEPMVRHSLRSHVPAAPAPAAPTPPPPAADSPQLDVSTVELHPASSPASAAPAAPPAVSPPPRPSAGAPRQASTLAPAAPLAAANAQAPTALAASSPPGPSAAAARVTAPGLVKPGASGPATPAAPGKASRTPAQPALPTAPNLPDQPAPAAALPQRPWKRRTRGTNQ